MEWVKGGIMKKTLQFEKCEKQQTAIEKKVNFQTSHTSRIVYFLARPVKLMQSARRIA